jgi:phosphate transport system substrate-binding protein
MTFSWFGWRALVLLLLGAAGCQFRPSLPPPQGDLTERSKPPQGEVLSDGITQEFTRAIAQLDQRQHPQSTLTVGQRTTDQAIQSFCQGQVPLIVVSRPLSAAEQDRCQKAGIETVKFPLGYAAVAAITSPDARWLACLTPAQLKKIDQALAQQQPLSWQQVDASYPPLDVQALVPSAATPRQLLREKGYPSLSTATPQLSAQAAEKRLLTEIGPIGFVGLAQATQLGSKALLVAFHHAAGDDCVSPSAETVLGGRYTDLARPMLAYASAKALDQQTPLQDFLTSLLQVVQAQARQQRKPEDSKVDGKPESAAASEKPQPPTPILGLPATDPALAAYIPISASLATELLDELAAGRSGPHGTSAQDAALPSVQQ